MKPSEHTAILRAFHKHIKCLDEWKEEESEVTPIDIHVIENYMSGGPGFVGSVAMLTFDSAPDCIVVMTKKCADKRESASIEAKFPQWEFCNEMGI